MTRIVSLRLGFLLALIGVLAACGSATGPAAPVASSSGGATSAPAATALSPAATALPRREPTSAPLATAAPAPTVAQPGATQAAEGAIAQGVTPEGYHFLGQADAPVTLVNYSDFL